MERHWINLTNGLQAIADHSLTDYHVMRLQSTHCEQKRWADTLASVPDEFMWHLAMGDTCVVYDYGARKSCPRAVWQGLELFRYVAERRWFGRVVEPNGGVGAMGSYFSSVYAELTKPQKHRLDYYGGFARMGGVERVSMRYVTDATSHDGDRGFMLRCAKNG